MKYIDRRECGRRTHISTSIHRKAVVTWTEWHLPKLSCRCVHISHIVEERKFNKPTTEVKFICVSSNKIAKIKSRKSVTSYVRSRYASIHPYETGNNVRRWWWWWCKSIRNLYWIMQREETRDESCALGHFHGRCYKVPCLKYSINPPENERLYIYIYCLHWCV